MKERISLALTNRIVNISVTAQNNTLFTHVFHLRETTSLRVENGREQPANVKNRGKNWSRGPPCRLPFAVNVMLNLSIKKIQTAVNLWKMCAARKLALQAIQYKIRQSIHTCRMIVILD